MKPIPSRRVPAAEIVQLVSAALRDAFDAMEASDPEHVLSLKTGAARQAVKEVLHGLKDGGGHREDAAIEYRQAMAFQDVEFTLALTLIDSIRRYERLSRFWTTEPRGGLTRSHAH
jgi:hypothetical protein